MTYISHRSVQANLGEALVIEIDPQKINYRVPTRWLGSNELKKKINKINILSKPSKKFLLQIFRKWDNFLIQPENFVPPPKEIKESPKYQKIVDLMKNIDSLEKTLWRKSLLSDLANNGFTKHKNIRMQSIEDIDKFLLEYVKSLYLALRSSGFKRGLAKDLPTALIDAQGNLIKSSSGYHRFYISRISGIKYFPVKIAGIHADFFESAKRLRKTSCSNLTILHSIIEETREKHK